MKLVNMPPEFSTAAPVLAELQAGGYEAYFVGGSVRDALLKQSIHDVDIATSAFPAEIKEIFPRTIDVGIEHGTVLVLCDDQQYEITTFRTESTYQDYRRPDKVEFVRSLKEDLKRRDFTINAFALKEDGEIIDLFDGLTDLANQTLRAVGNPHERFHEDALRMMRGLRFVSQLGFQLEEETFLSICENRALLEKISIERIHVEFMKLMLGTYRSQGLKAMVATECYLYCPGLRAHGETLLRLADYPDLPLLSESQAWGLLLDGLAIAGSQVKVFLKKWKVSNQIIHQVQGTVEGLSLRKQREWTPLTLYRFGLETALEVESLQPFFHQRDQSLVVREAYEALPIHSLQDLAINGNDILEQTQRQPGKWLREVLVLCEERVIQKELANSREALLTFVEKWSYENQ